MTATKVASDHRTIRTIRGVTSSAAVPFGVGLVAGLDEGIAYSLGLRFATAGYVTAIDPWLLRFRPEVAPAQFPHNLRRWRLRRKGEGPGRSYLPRP